jgi:hypothetical protein
MASYHELRRAVVSKGGTLEVDNYLQCYRAIAPPGKVWEPCLHEYIAVFGGGILGNNGTKAEAREDMYDRVTSATPEDCDDPECDMCA